jgi:hypothetical protein
VRAFILSDGGRVVGGLICAECQKRAVLMVSPETAAAAPVVKVERSQDIDREIRRLQTLAKQSSASAEQASGEPAQAFFRGKAEAYEAIAELYAQQQRGQNQGAA